MLNRHRLLQRQIRKYLADNPPPELTGLLDAVDVAYQQLDEDRAIIERSLVLSSAELGDANRALRVKQAELEANLQRIQAMQQQLVVQEKLASLGGLTAGIAHEIKNPLNFVNNFAELSLELADEMLELLQTDGAPDVAELRELCGMIKGNVDKVLRHGKRADGVVRGMLLHARGQAGERAVADFNALVDEYVSLAFHGVRARNPDLQLELERQLDPAVPHFAFAPQDLSRVVLNLVGNACDATLARREAEPDHRAHVLVQTIHAGASVRLAVRDNGAGVPAALREKIFEPFFTTKPPGAGTGLGLSICYDIVRSHGGELAIAPDSSEGSEFVVSLPYAAA